VGGAGFDRLSFLDAGTVASSAFTHVSGLEALVLSAGGNTVTLTNALVAGSSAGYFAVYGGTGDDTVDGSGVTNTTLAFFGSGGADTFTGGNGDDSVFIPDSAFAGINGNGGLDRIILTTPGQSFDLTANNAKITNTEIISLSSSAAASLTLAGTDIPLINSGTDLLYVVGEADDHVTAGAGWTVVATNVVNNAVASGHTFIEYQNTNGALLYIDTAITPIISPLLAAQGGVQASSTPSETHDLTQTELDSAVVAAIGLWKLAGASDAQVTAMQAIHPIADHLDGSMIGDESVGQIAIDTDAAGHGWFIDSTPTDNSEFAHAQNAAGTDLLTDPSSAAAGHLDLLTVVTHELGHAIGLEDSTAASDANDLMYLYLVDGERRIPDATDVTQANAQAAEAAVPVAAQAAAGTPAVSGTAGNDTVDAGHGGNILFGGAGADNFVFGSGIQLNAPTPAQITHVTDYSAAQGDTFDFSALTSAFHNSSVSDSLMVRAVEDASGKFATLQVDHIDPMGLPSAPNWVNVAQLDGAHSGDAVNILIDSHSSVHLAQIHVDLLA
jgi:Ca2+-binding RTX toxin-like protein